MAFTTLSGTLLKITGTQVGPGGSIAAGTVLTSVTLTTIDQDSGPLGVLGLVVDPYTLINSESLSLRINGQQVASTLPNLYATQITTSAGTFTALAFVIGSDTYLLPQTQANFASVSTVTVSSPVNTTPVTSITAADYGLRPENANTFTGQVYSETREFGSSTTTNSISTSTIYDADTIRGNADSAGEETGTGALSRVSSAGEFTAVLTFRDGTTLGGVEAIVTSVSSAYGPTVSSYLFNEADLAAAGRSLADVARVSSLTATDHNLNWEALGFDLIRTGNGVVTPDPVATPAFNVIRGTNANNTIAGTSGNDAIYGLGGNDTLRGGAGHDGFVFGSETRNGRREVDTIRDYEVGQDAIYFDDNAVVRSVTNINGGVRITFAVDGDRVDVLGSGLNTYNVGIFSDDFLV